MKKVRYFFSSFLLLVLCLDIIRLPITIFSETVSATTPLTIRTKYIEHLKEDGQKLTIKLDTSQKQLDRLDVIVQIEEGVDISKGLSLVVQNELELESQLDEQGVPKEKLPPGFVKDEDYREEDVPKEFPEQEVAPTVATQDSLESSLPVYGLGYYSIKIKPEPERHIEWKVDEEKPERRYEEILLRLKIKKPLQTGQFMAVLSSDYKTILTEDWKTFEELVKRNSIEMVTDSVASDTEQPIPETSESTSDNTQSNPVPEGEEVIQEEQALAIQTANLRLVLREHEEGVLQPSKPIAGAEFIITSVENPEISYNGRTDEQGILDWKDLPLGEYQISQLSTAQGYEVEKQLTVIQLQESGAEKIIHVTNAKKNGLEGRIGSMLRSARTRRAITETNTDRTTTTTTTTVSNNTTTTYTREESIFKYIFNPITISIPGVQQNYSQDGVLKKKEVIVDATNTTKIVWEYTTTVDGANNKIASIRNAFSTTTDSGLGEPKITSVTRNGVPLSINPTYLSTENFKSATDVLPVENGTYVYRIETPVVIPSDNYSLDYRSEVVVQAPKGSKLTYNGSSVTLSQDETRTLSTADTITLPAYQDGGPLGNVKVETVNTSNDNRTIGKYRDNKVIEWTSSRLNESNSPQNFTFDVALDDSQSLHEHKVYIYEPSNGTYREAREETHSSGNRITVNNVPPGAIALIKTVTNVRNEKVNHTISGAQLEALKGDIKIQKNWVNGAPPVELTFKVTGGGPERTVKLPANSNTITVNDVDKFEGAGTTAMKKRIHYEVNEVVPAGYRLSSATFDLETLTYLFNNQKVTSSDTPTGPPGAPINYGITSVQPIDINYLKFQGDGAVWGGFHGSLRLGFKLPPFAKEGDSFTVELPEELKLDHPANPNKEWTPVINPNNNKVIAKVYHTEDRKVKFVLTADAYSVQEYDGWYEIGSPANNVIQKNNESFRGTYLTGITPVLPKWYEMEEVTRTILNKQLNFKGSYTGSSFSYNDKTVSTEAKLNATNNGSSQGDLHQFDGVNKYEYEQGEDYIKWDLMYNTGRGNADWGLLNSRQQFWDYIHEGMRLYSHGNVAASIPKDIELFIADGTAAASYANPIKMKMTGENGGTYTYRAEGTDIKVDVRIKPEVHTDGSFDNFRSTHTLEFYYENVRHRAIVARIKMRKVSTKNGMYYNGARRAQNRGVSGATIIYRRTGDTAARGGAYPTDWYSLKLKKVRVENGQRIGLEGSVFTIYDANNRPYQTVRSGANGEFTFSNLLGGTYTFREISAPAGYILDPTEHRIVVTNSQNITIDGKQYDANNLTEIVNTKPISLQINKFEVGESRLLKGAVFRLKSKTGGDYDVTIGNTVAASQFVFSNLTPGTYTLTETQAPSGYKTISPVDIQVYEENGVLKIRKLTDPTNTQTGALELVNGNFTMNIVDEDFNTEFTKVNERGDPLEDAVFELRQITASGYRRVLTGLTSNSQGKLRVDHLLAGMTYELWETRAPSGYSKLTTAAARFTVSDTGTIRFETGNARITNQAPAYKVKVQKVDAVTGRPVTIQTRIGIANSQGEIIERQVASFNNGEFLFTKRFAPGTYYIKEEGTPSGYIGLSGVVPFTIHADGTVEVSNSYLEGIDVTTSSPDTITIKVKNYPLGKFKVSKRVKGISDMTNLITGQMTFTLTKNDDPNVTIVKQQAANQDFVFENLQPGVYTLTETQAPSGYIKSTETYTIHVDRDGSVRFYPNSDTSSHLATGLRVIKSAEIAAAATHGSSTEDKALDGTLTTGALY
ncbi:SpaA isopeptide-forming pilin-related protein, partial [Streptococcus suis]|uniref:SpaA isopeptide-forming pilin-related protein n=2 Tax=Streptococcus suis TaxID=1307 RepID=UPI001EDF1182